MQRLKRIGSRVEDRKEGGAAMKESARVSEKPPGVERKKSHLEQVSRLRRRYDALGYHLHRISEKTTALQDIRLTVGELDASRMTGLPLLVWPVRLRVGGWRSSVTLRLGYFAIFLQTQSVHERHKSLTR